MRPDQKRALSDLRCAASKLHELLTEANQHVVAAYLENAVDAVAIAVHQVRDERKKDA